MEQNQIINYKGGRKGIRVPNDVKAYIIKRVKEGEKTVKEISAEHGLGIKAIYKWLKDETGGSADPLISKLQKENQLLKQLVAELSLKIIESEKYEEVIHNPCLVSALYYSEQGVQKMTPPHEHKCEQIIWEVYPLITKKFRENYIRYLESVAAENSSKINFRAQAPILDRMSMPTDITGNHLDAMDLFMREGAPIYSMQGGIVVLAENDWRAEDSMSTSSHRGGNTVIVFNPINKSFYRYAHMEYALVSPGTPVPAGKKIGIVGHSGINASKPGHGEHVHFEINRYDVEKGVMIPLDGFELKRKIEEVTR